MIVLFFDYLLLILLYLAQTFYEKELDLSYFKTEKGEYIIHVVGIIISLLFFLFLFFLLKIDQLPPNNNKNNESQTFLILLNNTLKIASLNTSNWESELSGFLFLSLFNLIIYILLIFIIFYLHY